MSASCLSDWITTERPIKGVIIELVREEECLLAVREKQLLGCTSHPLSVPVPISRRYCQQTGCAQNETMILKCPFTVAETPATLRAPRTMRLISFLSLVVLVSHCDGHHEGDSAAVSACKAFIQTQPQYILSRFEARRDQESYLVFTNTNDTTVFDNYIKFAVQFHNVMYVQDRNATTRLCIGVDEMVSKVRLKDRPDSYLANVLVFPRNDIPVGVVDVDTACWLERKKNAITDCGPLFHPMPGLLNTSLFVHSPLEQDFWTNLDDQHVFRKDWILKMFIGIDDGKVPASWLQKLQVSSLTELHLWGSAMERPQSLFGSLPHLKVLHLTNSSIETLPGSIYMAPNVSRLPLLTLDLSYNNLTTLPTHTFSHLGNLQSLLLRYNSFEACPEESLSHLTRLKYLHLSGNRLSNISSACFRRLNQITLLYLSDNQIASLGVDVFRYIPHLQQLDLSHNQLVTFDTAVFATLTHLKTLNVSSNRIRTVRENPALAKLLSRDDDDFDSVWNTYSAYTLQSVNNLNFSHNALETATEGMLRYFGHIDVVDLGRNNFNCCHSTTPVLKRWINTPNVRYLDSNIPFTCSLQSAQKYILIKDFDYTVDTCKINVADTFGIQLWIPLGLLAVVASVVAVVLYTHRFELTYMRHLFQMKRRGMETDEERYGVCSYDAFVCYSGKNFLWVSQQLLPNLEKGPEQYRLCLHDRDFALGSAIDTNIVVSIEKSRKVIIVLTQDFINSKWCQWELEMANHKTFEESRDYVILIELERLDRRTLPRHLRYLMDTRTYLEWPQDQRRAAQTWRRLREALGESIADRTGRKPEKNRTVLDP